MNGPGSARSHAWTKPAYCTGTFLVGILQQVVGVSALHIMDDDNMRHELSGDEVSPVVAVQHVQCMCAIRSK